MNVGQQPLGSDFDQIKDRLKIVIRAIIRVGNVQHVQVRSKFQKKLDFMLISPWAHVSQIAFVPLVHGQNVIKLLEVFALNLTGAQAA